MTIYNVFFSKTLGVPKPSKPDIDAERETVFNGWNNTEQETRGRRTGGAGELEDGLRARVRLGEKGQGWARNTIEA